MRWLTVTVAGSFFCRRRILLAGLVGTCGLAQAQTIEVVVTPPDVMIADCNRTVALVQVVTDRNEADQTESIGWKPMPQPGATAQVTVVTQGTQLNDLKPAATKRNISVGQVTIVTESNANDQDQNPDHRLEADATQPPLPPSEFNPDPGAAGGEAEPETMPPELFPPILPQTPTYGEEALPRSLQ